ncbi:hypothetical protein V1527DRAFT_462948 [Lipomyces starkeyi]
MFTFFTAYNQLLVFAHSYNTKYFYCSIALIRLDDWTMDGLQVTDVDSKYCQKCAACRTRVCCDTLQELQQMYSGMDGRVFRLGL